MTQPFKVIETKTLSGRVATIVVIVAAVAFAWFSIRWQIGNMFGSLTQPNAPNAESVAEFAHSVSPNDPITNWLLGTVYKDDFEPEKSARAIGYFESMVRNAPYDHRSWIELARALEAADQNDRAESAFRHAVGLAPAYSYTHWHLGNFFLRKGRESEAIGEFRIAAEASKEYREQVFAIAWDYFEKDPVRLEGLVGQNPEVRAGLAKFFAAKELATESLRIWNTLTPDQKQEHQDVAKVIAQALYEKKYFRSAVAYVRQLALEPSAELGSVQNGGFESPIPEDAQKVYFNWRTFRIDKIDVKTDQLKKRDGNRSLRVNFSGFSGIEIKNFWQVAAVEPSARYRLTFWIRTEALKSAGTPLIEVVNANDNKLIVTSPAFPADAPDWTEMKVEFATPADSEGVLIRLDRAYCGDSCPIFGTVWLDDFKLEKLSS